MKGFDLFRFIIASLIALFLIIYSIVSSRTKRTHYTAKFLVRSAIFAAFSIILYNFEVFNLALPIFPPFLKIHFDEIPVFIAGFAYGPLSAIFILIVKTIIKLPLTNTMCVGEVADLIYSLAFVLPACLFYRKHKSVKGAFVSFLIGMVFQLLASTFITTFIMLKVYSMMMPGLTPERILAMCKAVNPSVTSLTWPFFFFISLPFNAIKDVLVIVLTFILYKRLHKVIDNYLPY